ncbi:uncharacterized protein TNCT_72221 [Trichonephila clavata]|uniref:G domain-containing protein n=1 Tax=Trichonephila clavata TaxID=2740835 RepID=A0A8X6LL33_TRICU|nr:uncharacterized protein TNCT_72221 [Trichonephila clavata]
MDPSHYSCHGKGLASSNTKKFTDNPLGDNESEAIIGPLLDLLKRGDEEIILRNEFKNVVLILGNTGSGKSAFLQWIAGDNSKLVATEVVEKSGEFIIEDNDRIGDSTIKSKTVFPELIIDTVTDTAFYDCPGFSDTRSTSHDIATTYFIKTVLDYVESVKMIFVINYPSVRKGVERQDFMKLIRHVTDLVKDVDKFRNSFALMVSKVDNQYSKKDGCFALVENDIVIGSIANFLREVKKDVFKSATIQEKEFCGSSTKLIDALLEKDGEQYLKIGIFRRPDEPGLLSEIDLVQKEKMHVKFILHEKLNFAKKKDDDFGYTISENSKIDIYNLVEEINRSVWCDASNIADKIQKYCHDLVEEIIAKLKSFISNKGTIEINSSEAEIFSTKISNAYKIILDLSDTDNSSNMEYLSRKLNDLSNENFGIEADDVISMTNRVKYLNFLQIVNDRKLNARPWTDLYKSTLTYLTESRRKIQDEVYCATEKIKSRILIELNFISKAIREHYNKFMKLSESQKLPSKLKEEHGIMSNMIIEMKTVTIEEQVLEIIKDTLKRVNINVPGEYFSSIVHQLNCFEYLKIISIKELNIGSSMWVDKFQEVVCYLHESEKWYLFLNELFFKLSQYEVYVNRHKYNVAYLEDWGESDRAQGIAITENSFRLFLHKLAKFNLAEVESIKNITTTALRLEEINHVLDLTLKCFPKMRVSGDYVFVEGNSISMKEILSDDLNRASRYKSSETDLGLNLDLKGKTIKYLNILALNTIYIDCDISFPGLGLQILAIAPKLQIVGKRVIDLGGTNVEIKGVTRSGIKGRNEETKESCEAFLKITEQFVNSADLTVIARNLEDISMIHESSSIVNEYKSFLRRNLVDRFKKCSLLQFLDKLEIDTVVENAYDTLGLVNEMQCLEDQFHELSQKVDFVPFYYFLLNRITRYAINPKLTERSVQHKKVLNYLYTATLGRIYNLEGRLQFSLITDIEKYLNLVTDDIQTLKNLQKLNNKAVIVKKHTEIHKRNLDLRIEEANNFITEQIMPEIDNISFEIESKVDLLVKETIALQNQVLREKEALIKKRQELEEALELKRMFGCFKIIGQVISFLGPFGVAVGSLVNTTASVAESLVLSNHENRGTTLQLSESVTCMSDLESFKDQVIGIKSKKIAIFKKLLKEIHQEADTFPNELKDLSNGIVNIKNKLSEICGGSFNFKDLQLLEVELKQELNRKKGELETDNSFSNNKTNDALQIVGKLNQIAEFGSICLEVKSELKNDQIKIDEINEIIQQAGNKFLRLKDYEDNIYSFIAPMLQSMENNIHNIAENLHGRSHVSLDVTKWKVQTTLKDIKLQMQQLTQGFQVKDNLARCIEKLEEIMTTIINIYDRIQSYQEQQNLASYIADISSSSSCVINIDDSKLINAVNHLESLIRSNIALKQYKTIIHSFSQWVFPFAHNYLEKSQLPSHLELEKSLENLATKAVTEIKNLKMKIGLYKISVTENDKSIQSSEFSSRYVSTEPFFIWKNEQHKSTISKLLSGQKVAVKADVNYSAINKDAIKFTSIEFYLKSIDEAFQPELNNVLKGFDIKATHMGNSYYRYKEKIYLITSNSQSISYSFEKNGVGEPIRRNNVFNKIKNGDLMLSPYTVWEIQIISSGGKSSFKDLEIYKDKIDLELIGCGSYVTRDTSTRMINFIDDVYETVES